MLVPHVNRLFPSPTLRSKTCHRGRVLHPRHYRATDCRADVMCLRVGPTSMPCCGAILCGLCVLIWAQEQVRFSDLPSISPSPPILSQLTPFTQSIRARPILLFFSLSIYLDCLISSLMVCSQVIEGKTPACTHSNTHLNATHPARPAPSVERMVEKFVRCSIGWSALDEWRDRDD